MFAFGTSSVVVASVCHGDVMTCRGVIGSVKEKRVEVSFEWTIPDFSSLTASPGEYFDSPPFSAACCSWYLRLYPYSRENRGYVSLYLCKEDSGDDKNVSFSLGVKNASYETDLSTQTFNKHQLSKGKANFHERNSLWSTLTLTCRIKDNMSPLMEVAPQQMKLAELETLSTNLRDLYTSKSRSDVTIRVGNDTQFQVHKAILAVRSRVFAAMFEHGMSEDETCIVTIEDCDSKSFGDFLEYLYTGKIEREVSFEDARQLYITADKYDVRELKSFCIAYLMHNLTVENVCDVVTMAEQYGDAGLMSAAQIFFNGNVDKILSTTRWEELLRENHLLANRLFKEIASKIKSQTEVKD